MALEAIPEESGAGVTGDGIEGRVILEVKTAEISASENPVRYLQGGE